MGPFSVLTPREGGLFAYRKLEFREVQRCPWYTAGGHSARRALSLASGPFSSRLRITLFCRPRSPRPS